MELLCLSPGSCKRGAWDIAKPFTMVRHSSTLSRSYCGMNVKAIGVQYGSHIAGSRDTLQVVIGSFTPVHSH